MYRPDFRYPMNSGRNMLGRGRHFSKALKQISPEARQRLRTKTPDKSCAREGGDVFPEFPSHLTHQGANNNSQHQRPRETFFFSHIKRHLEGCIQTSISKDASNEASRRMHTTKHLEGCTQTSTESSRIQVSPTKRTSQSRRLQQITTGPN